MVPLLAMIVVVVLSPVSRLNIHPVAGSLALFQINAAWLLVRRPRGSRPNFSRSDVACTLPSLLVSSILLAAAPSPAQWPFLAQAVFVGGATAAVVSLSHLGEAFGFLPACRIVRSTGPYRVIRHPAYLGELMMTVAAGEGMIGAEDFTASRGFSIGTALAALFVGLIWRIRVEERHLANAEEWAEYTRATRYRLVPGVW